MVPYLRSQKEKTLQELSSTHTNSMESHTFSMDVKVMSCNDLKSFNFFQKLSVYAVVSIGMEDGNEKETEKEKLQSNKNKKKRTKQQQQQQQQKTPIDREGDGNPVWNHSISFDFKGDEWDRVFIEFDLRSEAIPFGDKKIGQVRVPIKDLMPDNDTPFRSSDRIVRFVSYQVRSPEGKPNGVLHLSYKMNSNDDSKTGAISITAPPLAHHDRPGQKISPLSVSPLGGTAVDAYYPNVEVESSSLAGVHYPSVELDPLPPLSLSLPAPLPGQAWYSAPPPEFYYGLPPPSASATPPPPASIGAYYIYTPPPPPPRRPLSPPPVRYGCEAGSFCYGVYGRHEYRGCELRLS